MHTDNTPTEDTTWHIALEGVKPLDRSRYYQQQVHTSTHARPRMNMQHPPAHTMTDSTQIRLDLHDMTQQQAHTQLARHVKLAYKHKTTRSLLVITGKGTNNEGVLKRLVPLWCEAPALARYIRALYPAERTQGGDGALIIYLKKR